METQALNQEAQAEQSPNSKTAWVTHDPIVSVTKGNLSNFALAKDHKLGLEKWTLLALGGKHI